MKFKTYIIENIGSMKRDFGEKRSIPISTAKAKTLIDRNCSAIVESYKNNKTRIIRRNKKLKESTVFIDPTTSTKRKSINTFNYYTLLMDEILKSWSKYPKRSKSVICRTVRGISSYKYSKAFLVIPYDKCKIGVCSLSDIWLSFTKGFKGVYLVDLMEQLNSIFLEKGYNPTELEDDPTLLRMALKSIGPYTNDRARKFFNKYGNKNFENLFELMKNRLDPGLNNFDLIKPSEFNDKHFNKELWIGDGPSIMTMDDIFIEEILG